MNMGSWYSVLLWTLVLTPILQLPAAQVNLAHAVSKTAAGAWDGGDAVNLGGEDGTMTLEASVAKAAMLKVTCNSKDGYSIAFSSASATGTTTGKVYLDGTPGTEDQEIPYTASLDLSGVTNATVSVLGLSLNTGASAVRVNFNSPGNKTPKKASNANEIQLMVTLDPFDITEKESGSYSDVITATVTVN